MNTTSPAPLAGRVVWNGKDLEQSGAWVRQWPAGAAEAIDAAWSHAKSKGLKETAIRRQDFPLPSLQGFLQGLLDELEDGLGLVRVTGFPVERYAKEDLKSIFWGIGTHLGTALYQTAAGEIIGEVRDESMDGGRVTQQIARQQANDNAEKPVLASRARARSNGPLRFHTDRSDVIALFCVDDGMAGGVSKLVSVASIYNTILERRPDLHGLLCQDYWRMRPEDEWGATAERLFKLPVFGVRDGKLTTQYSRTYVEQAQEVDGVPKLTKAQDEALDMLAAVAEELCMQAPFHPGDMQLLNNHVIFHGRTAFADDQTAGRKRLLLRLWFSVANSRALPEGHEILWGSIERGALRGGVTSEADPSRRTPVAV
jgi:hypothetical protein